MKRKLLLAISFLTLTIQISFAQNQIDVTDQTIKISALSEQVLYFGFTEGDQILFNLTEINGKELKEVEIIEFPTSSKFSDYKTIKIENKVISVNNKAIYKFRFFNSSLGGRVCKIKIQRIPSNDITKNFKTNIVWKTKQDTTWNSYTKEILIGYDTLKVKKVRRELIKTEVNEELIMYKTQRVHSKTNENGNKTFVFFTLPQNQITEHQTTTVKSWAYWVGVGEEANVAWRQNSQTIKNLAKGSASYFTSPLGALAIGAITDLILPKIGEDVSYSITNQENKDKFWTNQEYRIWDTGKGVAGYKKFLDPNLSQGTFFVLLSNDNDYQGIDASVKVVAILENQFYEDKQYIEKIAIPKYETKTYREPIITTIEFPTLAQ